MCFIDKSSRDHPFRLDETHVRVKKYCVLSIRMDGGPASYLHGVVTKPVRTPTARAVWGMIIKKNIMISGGALRVIPAETRLTVYRRRSLMCSLLSVFFGQSF